MGVAGLWEVLRPAGQVRSLTELAIEDGFKANPSRQRGFRIGIDASIWFFHAAYGREGENPELRTLFFRCCRLLQSPLLPLFVFDGPNRPAVKRSTRVGGNTHWLTEGMKNIIDAFGFEWRLAPGEAEAELAYLNRIGIIDAVLSDDVDNFLFGATMVIRNPSHTLSGNRAHPVKNAQGKDDGNHVVTYTADAILSNPSVALSRPGTILIGLLSGGDYIPAGLPGCGQKFATGLARAGFGDSLVKAVKELKGAKLDTFLDQWRQDIRNELRTNKSGLLPSKKPSLAASLPDDFPSLPVLLSYADPLTSENTPQKGNRKTPLGVWRNDPDPMRIASLCELYFEWGVKDIIIHRFRTVLWPGIVCRAIRRVVVDEDARHRGSDEEDKDTIRPSSPTKQISSALSSLALSSQSKKKYSSSAFDLSASECFTLSSLVSLTSSASDPSPLLLEVVSQRAHASTDSTLEYRVLVDPTTFVERAESGVKGLRPPLVGGLFGVDPEDEDADGSTLDHDVEESRSDDAIERLETAAGAASKSGTKRRKARREIPTTPLRLWLPACMIRAAAPALAVAYEEKVRVREEKKAKRGSKGVRGRRAGIMSRNQAQDDVDDDDVESATGCSSSKTVAGSKAKSNAVRVGVRGARRKPKQASEAQDDAYEFIDLSAGESPCSSDEDGVSANTKGKREAGTKTSQANVMKPTKAAIKTDTTSGKATTTNTTKGYYTTTKSRTTKTTNLKPSSQLPTAKVPTQKPVCVYEEEKDSSDATVPLPLPKSSRPLDLLRAKRRLGTVAPNLLSKSKSKSTTVPRYEEGESPSSSPPIRPSGSKPDTSSLPSLPVQLGPQVRKKPLFVDVLDTDSDIEVSDVRHPLFGTTATIPAQEGRTRARDDDASVSIGESRSTFASKYTSRAVGGTIDLATKGNPLRSKSAPSTSMPTASLLPVYPVSTPGEDVTGPTLSARPPSKLAHILLPQSTLESEDEDETEGDELPMFHRDSARSRTKRTAMTQSAPRPFPMRLVSESPISPRASTLREKNGTWDEADSDVIEIVDVFTTPRGPSPPRSPTISPSVQPPPIRVSAGSSTSMKSRQSNESLASPTTCMSQTDTESHKKTRQRHHVSSECDTPSSGNERDSAFKSPRKSAAHSSPRHVSHPRECPLSPTPLVLSNAGSGDDNTVLWTDEAEERNTLDGRQPDNLGPARTRDGVWRKPRTSDASAIYISSGSEDEDDAGHIVHDNRDVREAEDRDECTDRDTDAWADTAMILSVPPLLATSASDHLVPTIPSPTVEAVLFNPVRASKFKPTGSVAATRVDICAPASCRTPSMGLNGSANDEDTIVPLPARRAPLFVARAKRSKGGDDDVIDLTSD